MVNFFGQSSFSTYALCTEANLVKVPKELNLEILGPLGCGINTGAGAVLNSLKVTPGSTIAVFGTGAVGLSAIMAAKVAGCSKIIGIDIQDERLKFAKELGATHIFNIKKVDVKDEILKLTGTGLNYSLDTTGNPDVLKIAVESLEILGTCGLVGVSPPGTQAQVDMLSLLFGRTLKGIIEGDSVPQIFIPKLIEYYQQGRFPFDKMITFYEGLGQINQAVEDTKTFAIKPIIRVSKL